MPGSTHTYDLTQPELANHPLSSGRKHIQRLAADLKECRGDDPTKINDFKDRLARLSSKPRGSINLAAQEEIIYLTELLKYAENYGIIGVQLGKDINRVDSNLVGFHAIKGSEANSIMIAKMFLENMTLTQKILADQSQGLARPTNDFFSQYLRLPGQPEAAQISPSIQRTSATTFSRVGGERLPGGLIGGVLTIERLDNCYTFDTQTTLEEESPVFFYKMAGKAVQSASILEDSELFAAIKIAVDKASQKPLDSSNSVIDVEYPKGTIFKIEPIISVKNSITMGPKDESPSWKVTVTTNDDSVKLTDGIFSEKAPQKTDKKPIDKKVTDIDFIVVSLLTLALWAAAGGVVLGVIGLLAAGPIGFAIGFTIGASLGAGTIGYIMWTSKHNKSVEVLEVNKTNENREEAPSPTVADLNPVQRPGLTTQFKHSKASLGETSLKDSSKDPEEEREKSSRKRKPSSSE